MDIYRGDIFYVENSKYFNVEQQFNTEARPAIIVSNDKCNAWSDECTVVYLTTKDKRPDLPTHVPVICKVPSTALCETVCKISQRRIGEFIRRCTDAEMQAIDKGLMAQLGIETSGKTAKELEALEEEGINAKKALNWSESERARLTAEIEKRNEAYKELDEKRAALEAELRGEKIVSDGYGREVAMLHEERDRLNAKLEAYRTTENTKIRELEEALDAEKANAELYKAQLDAQVAANEHLQGMVTAAHEQEAEEREDEQEVFDLTPTEVRMLIETQDENIRLKAEIDVYKAWLGKLIPQLA